jgi:glycosyltransferase involved in cell wall biosynthesis
VERAVSAADAVVARVPSALGQAAITAARALGKPYAVEVVGCPWDTYANHGSLAGRLYAPLATARMKRAVRSAPLALYVTERWLQGRYPARGLSSSASNVELIPPDEAAFESRRLRLEELRKGRPPKLGSVASLRVKYKGVQTAIAALARLRREGLSLPYAVLGPGDPEPWRGMARNFGVEDLVSFDGTRPAGSGVLGWLDEIDIHLQPSFQEGLPRSTIEAMSRGAACVGSTCGGIPELLPAERTHRPGDVQGLARIIARLGTDSAEIAEASRIGFERARAYYPDVLRERRDVVIGALRDLAEQQAGRSERIAG